MLKTIIKKTVYAPIKSICKYEYKNRQFDNRLNERAVEFAFVFKHLARIYPRGKVLDVGTGTSALPHLISNIGFSVTAIDNIKDYWTSGMFNRHYYIIDDDITDTKLKDKFDFITCISVLEHIEKHNEAFDNMFNLLNNNGLLILTFPYTENRYIPNVYEEQGSSYGQNAPYICRSYSRNELNNWLREKSGIIIEQEYWQFWEGDFWTQYSQIIPPRRVDVKDKHQISCILIKKFI